MFHERSLSLRTEKALLRLIARLSALIFSCILLILDLADNNV